MASVSDVDAVFMSERQCIWKGYASRVSLSVCVMKLWMLLRFTLVLCKNLKARSARLNSSVLDTELSRSCSLSENYFVLYLLDVLFYKCVSKAMNIVC